MRPKLLPKKQNDKLNSKVKKTLTYQQLMDLLASQPVKIKALIS